MKNIALILSYDGTNYNGWQVQKNGPSIQESTETAVCRLLGQKVHVSRRGAHGLGRARAALCRELQGGLHHPDGPPGPMR